MSLPLIGKDTTYQSWAFCITTNDLKKTAMLYYDSLHDNILQ